MESMMSDNLQPYEEISRALSDNGFASTLLLDEGGGRPRLACGKELTSAGLLGGRFWLALRRNRWFLGTWAPHIYELSDPDQVIPISLALLSVRTSFFYKIPDELLDKFDIQEITEHGFDEVEMKDVE